MGEISKAKLTNVQGFLSWFKDQDTNRNGVLDRGEISESDFKAYDITDNNGIVTIKEVLSKETERFRQSLGISNYLPETGELTLSSTQDIHENTFPSGSRVTLSDLGNVMFAKISKDQTFSKVNCKGESTVVFGINEDLVSAILASDQTVDGKALKAGTFVSL